MKYALVYKKNKTSIQCYFDIFEDAKSMLELLFIRRDSEIEFLELMEGCFDSETGYHSGSVKRLFGSY